MTASLKLSVDLAAAIGRHHVYDRPADLAAYAYDAFGASGERHLPDAVVFPGNTEEVAAVVRICAHHRVPVIARGAGTGYAGGSVASGGVVVVLTRMDRILNLDTKNNLISVEAGVVTAAVHEAAAQVGLYYPPDPGSLTTSTIGGNIACNAAGSHALRYGTTGDYVVGITAVLANGEVAVVGNGTGTDLLGLLIGSEGTLGIITEAVLRLIPAPQSRTTIAATFRDVDAAAAAVAEITDAGIVPSALEYMDQAALDAVARSGYAQVDVDAGALLLTEYEGDASDVEATTSKLVVALTKAGAQRIETAHDLDTSARLWRVRKAISAAVAAVKIGKVNEDVVVPRHHVATVVKQAREIAAKHELPMVTFGHAGDGNLHLTALIDPRVSGERTRAEAAMAEIFQVVIESGGSITGEHGVGTSKLGFVEQQLGPDGVEVMRKIKRTLDPQALMNPGKKVPV